MHIYVHFYCQHLVTGDIYNVCPYTMYHKGVHSVTCALANVT
jgi:hypothetical protein